MTWRSDPSEAGGDAFGEVLLAERRENRIERALDYPVERVERQVHAVVGEPVLRKVVGADALGA